MAIANLNDENLQVDTGNDNIVIVDNFQSVRGGRTLNVAGFVPPVINAGHVIIRDTGSGDYKPMPVTGSGGISALGTITPGSGYTNDGTYQDVSLTGGSGTGAKADIVVTDHQVSSVTIKTRGAGYRKGDSLSAAAANIGTTGTGFLVDVSDVDLDATAYGTLPGSHEYAGILIASVKTSKPFAGILLRGTVNYKAAPYPMDTILSAVKAALSLIKFVED